MIDFNSIEIQGGVIACTVGEGPFHPAVQLRATGKVYYWPNITQADEMAAVAFARDAIDAAFYATAQRMRSWNVFGSSDSGPIFG